MKSNNYYASYNDYMVCYNVDSYTLTVTHSPTRSKATMILDGLWLEDEEIYKMSDYDGCIPRTIVKSQEETHELCVTFKTDKPEMPKCELHIYATPKGITLTVYEISNYTIRIKGDITHQEDSAFMVNLTPSQTDVIYAAIGPSASRCDNSLYSPVYDSAFCILGCQNVSFAYDWKSQKYNFEIKEKSEGITERVLFTVKENVLAEKYDVDFKPLKARSGYNSAPAGWMTWYAVQFDASEEAVLRNTRFQQEVLKDFGADTIWVDWEWCHKAYEKERFDGVNNFNPDPDKYPNGLKYVADKIKEAGFKPALWIGFVSDVGLTEYEKAHPEISLTHKEYWCGSYFYDASSDEYINGFLTKAIKQVKSWGFDAIKFDTLPEFIDTHEVYHSDMHNPDMTTYQAYRRVVEKAREEFGDDFFMLSCGGSKEVTLWGVGVFDSSRIGPDVFTWDKFLINLDLLRELYPLHNIAILNDVDNLILRDEYSNFEQAVSRASLVSLLGLPVNLGDDLPLLSDKKLDIIKRILPAMKVHPTDFNNARANGESQTICLKVEAPFESYTLVGVMNLTDKKISKEINITKDLRLFSSEYLVYDFFADSFIGETDDSISIDIAPYDTKVLSIRKKAMRPQLLSTSRHITQGVAEIKNMSWENNTLSIISTLVNNDPYTITLFVPSGFELENFDAENMTLENNILRFTIVPSENGEFEFVFKFKEV